MSREYGDNIKYALF